MHLRPALALPLAALTLALLLGAQPAPSPAPEAHPIAARIQAIETQRDADFAKGGSALMVRNVLAAAETLLREFPDRPEPYDMLVDVGFELDDEPARQLFTRVHESPVASAGAKKTSALQLARLAHLGQPFALKFTTLDGAEFDSTQHRGKVVVIDWWATWCPPCVKDLPEFRETVKRYESRGVVFVGISLDSNREKLTTFVAQEAVTWPQFFDGQGWKNKLATEYSIRSIPAVWLVDKRGVLRHTDGREALPAKLDRLLAE